MMRTLVVVNGGDAPGINAVITRYTSLAERAGDSVLGASGGFEGVLNNNIQALKSSDVRLLAGRGGTYLQSSREPALRADDAQGKLQTIMDEHEIDNILLFGGDGTLHYILPTLEEWKIPTIGLPTTIDNDINGTDYTLGFDSACNFAYQAIDGVLATAHALPGRIFMVETLGGYTGFLALAIAQGAGAQMVLLPEYEFSREWLGERLKSIIAADGYALVVLSEGVSMIPEFNDLIPQITGIRLRYTRLGHAQRGGDVSHLDRQFAAEMSLIAHRAFHDGVKRGTVIVRDGKTKLTTDTIAGSKKAAPDRDLYNFINQL